MTQELYPLSNAAHVPMLGRQGVLARILTRIGKATGDHLSVVGAPYIGKTTLLRHLATTVGPDSGGYLAGVFLDLRHNTPTSDQDFRQRMLVEVRASLAAAGNEAVDLIDLHVGADDLPEHLSGLFDYLSDSGRLLIVMDGLDHVLRSPTISRNLWDYLREIGLKSSCTFVTGTRGRIRELCNNRDSLASEFWNIFADPIVELGPFEEQERDDVLKPLAAHAGEMESSARKEIMNWTGGHPALLALLCHTIAEKIKPQAGLNGATVNEIGTRISNGHYTLVQHLWDECPVELHGEFHALATNEAGAGSIPPDRVHFGAQRGFITPSKKPKLNCRFIEQMALRHGREAVVLKRLFSTETQYAQQMQRVLELRLGQVTGGDQKLRGNVARAIQELPAGPVETLNWIRLISRRALELIWAVELDDGKRPPAWAEAWKHEGNDGQKVMDRHQGAFPKPDGKQCAALRDITGGYGNLPIVARHVTRATYVLVEHVKSAGDLGQHLADELSRGYAVSVCLSCIELFARLAGELPAEVSVKQ